LRCGDSDVSREAKFGLALGFVENTTKSMPDLNRN
jgi:hypothetical protein